LNKNNYTNNIVSFNTLLIEKHDTNPFKIYDLGKSIQCISFTCSQEQSPYKCKCTLDLGYKDSAGQISIYYEKYNNQLRELFYILYSTDMRNCYEKEDDENLEITMEWSDKMEYQHYLYFSETPPLPLNPTSLSKKNIFIVK
jgi:hypothetical protein